MKQKITAIVLMFALMAMLPFVTARCGGKASGNGVNTFGQSTADTVDSNADYSTRLCALTAAKYKDGYSLETTRALALILNTNYKLNPDTFSDDDFLFRENASGTLLEVYPQIENAVNSIKEKTLCKNNKAFYIPFSDSSDGCTYKSDDYSYIQAVASPWDCFGKNYSEDTRCVGVSLSGVDYLCKNGSNAEEALLWYLPEFEVIG